MSFITIEDINGEIYSNQDCFWHEINTAEIGNIDFENVAFDFVKISHTDNVDSHTFSFKLDNVYWTKAYYVLDKNGSYLDVSLTKSGDVYSFTTGFGKSTVRLFLQIGMIQHSEETQVHSILLNNKKSIYLPEIENGIIEDIFFENYSKSSIIIRPIQIGWNEVTNENMGLYDFIFINLIKTDFKFNCNSQLIVGKLNQVKLGTNTRYKPNGQMVGEYNPNIFVEHDGKTVQATWDSEANDYTFPIDLTDKRNTSNIRFKVKIEGNEVINTTETTVIIKSEYEKITSFTSLQDACAESGIEIVQIDSNLNFSSDILCKHSIKIIGDNHTFNLNGHSFNILEDVEFNAENIQFNVGNTTIIQQSHSKVNLKNCTFTNCTSNTKGGLGSCLFCDVDVENLSDAFDFETTLIDCDFINNESCVFHSGQLTVNGCRMHNTDVDFVNTNNVAFLYQTDGNASISNSIFDIDYDVDDFCENEINLGFAQCVIKIGETATVDGANYLDLGDDNSLPLFTQTTGNQSHLFAKYYYPKAETCVYASPIENYENKSCCHCVSGVDWIFKDNVQITRSSWNSENTKRIIDLED